MKSVKCLTNELLETVAQQAETSPRLRQNYNFHGLSERVQRLLNALQPGTYVRPHQHLRAASANGFEFFLVIQGEVGILLFNEQGEIIHQERLRAEGPIRGIELAEGQYHTLVALAPDTVILELKEGPYDPNTDKEFLTAFPEEGIPEARALVETWQHRFREPKNSQQL